MLTRAFNVIGMIVRIAECKASLLGFAARRSAIAMLGSLLAAIVAIGGMAVLLGAGYVELKAIVGVSLAMAAVGVCLLLIASFIWIIAIRRGKGTGHAMTEHDAENSAARDQELLRSMLGMTNNEAEPGLTHPGPRIRPLRGSNAINGLDDPKVLMAAGFAMLGLLGPGGLLRALRTAASLASVAALANRAVNEHRHKKGTESGPRPSDARHTAG